MNDAAYDNLVQSAAVAYASQAGVSVPDLVALIKAIIRQESHFDASAYRAEPHINDASRGLMQVLYSTAQALGYDGDPGNDDTHTGGLYDPHTSILYGTRLLANNLAQAGGALDVAISAYNAGFSAARPTDAKRDARGVIINQANYVDPVLSYFAEYQANPPTADGNGVTGGLPVWAIVALVGVGAVAALSIFSRSH